MKKRIFKLTSILLVLVMASGMFAACSSKPASSQAAPSAAAPAASAAPSAGAPAAPAAYEYPKMTLKIGTDDAETHPLNLAMVYWDEIIQEATGGNIKIENYPNAVLGSSDSMTTQVLGGSLDMCVPGGLNLLSIYDPQLSIELMPFLFKSNPDAMKALDSEFGVWLGDTIADNVGLQVLGYMCNGVRNIGNNVHPINTPADMKGLKFRAANTAILIEFFEAMDSAAIPMPFTEVFTALQQKTVDGFECPAAVFNSNHIDEVCKYLSLTQHAFTSYAPVANVEKFNQWPAEVQEIMLKTCKEAAVYQRDLLYAYEEQSVKDLESRGMIINEVDAAPFVEAVKPVWDKYIATYGRTAIDLALEGQK